ncbi:MAG: hypothetical protein ACP5U1_16590 [Desulfomonilaceae bacterium]
MNQRLQLLAEHSKCILVLFILIIFATGSLVFAQGSESSCAQLKEQWEQVCTEIKSKIDGFNALDQTPIEQIIKKPLVNPSEHKTIAIQISEALQVKEGLLTEQRKELRNLMNSENKIYSELQHCFQTDKSAKRKDAGVLAKKRKALLDRALVTVAEVKEVEGRETVMPYTEASGQDQYRRSVNNQWYNYGDPRRWWGGY